MVTDRFATTPVKTQAYQSRSGVKSLHSRSFVQFHPSLVLGPDFNRRVGSIMWTLHFQNHQNQRLILGVRLVIF